MMFKQLASFFKKVFTRELKPASLRLLVIQPTTFCNLDCDYCYLPDRQLKHKLSLDLIEPIFQNIFDSNLINQQFTVVWHAGEPLTVPISFYNSAIDKIDKLNQEINPEPYAITHSFQTNGILINQQWCDFIKQNNIRIGVSLDGPAFIHDFHRKTRTGLGTHASTMRGISLLKANQIPFSVIAVLSNISLDYPDEIFDFFVENDVKSLGFNIEEIEGTNLSSSLDVADNEERYRYFMKRFYQRWKQNQDRIRIREFDEIKHFICYPPSTIEGQFTPLTMINVAYDGQFSAFSPELLSMKNEDYGDFILGNILEHPVRSILKTDKFKHIFQEIETGVGMCHDNCPYFSVCGGGAPSNKYYENGTFASTETLYCKYTKKVIMDIILEDMEKELGLL